MHGFLHAQNTQYKHTLQTYTASTKYMSVYSNIQELVIQYVISVGAYIILYIHIYICTNMYKYKLYSTVYAHTGIQINHQARGVKWSHLIPWTGSLKCKPGLLSKWRRTGFKTFPSLHVVKSVHPCNAAMTTYKLSSRFQFHPACQNIVNSILPIGPKQGLWLRKNNQRTNQPTNEPTNQPTNQPTTNTTQTKPNTNNKQRAATTRTSGHKPFPSLCPYTVLDLQVQVTPP